MRPDLAEPLIAPPAVEADDTAWLITFSDLVLQLFGFVLLWAVLSVGAKASAPAPPAVVAAASAPRPAPLPEARRTWVAGAAPYAPAEARRRRRR
ncbi:MAG: flagellar motor protein MotB [bacterium]|nr:flagellar motor protein MotB [bacterium]